VDVNRSPKGRCGRLHRKRYYALRVHVHGMRRAYKNREKSEKFATRQKRSPFVRSTKVQGCDWPRSPGVISVTDAGPLCVRNWLLGIMLMQGFLADWQRGTEVDGSVCRVAANIPVNGVQFAPEAFVTRLGAERGTQEFNC
jgi:hypothetical protein